MRTDRIVSDSANPMFLVKYARRHASRDSRVTPKERTIGYSALRRSTAATHRFWLRRKRRKTACCHSRHRRTLNVKGCEARRARGQPLEPALPLETASLDNPASSIHLAVSVRGASWVAEMTPRREYGGRTKGATYRPQLGKIRGPFQARARGD